MAEDQTAFEAASKTESTMVLHGAWVRSPAPGRVFIWGEMKNGAAPGNGLQAASGDDTTPRPHPFCAPPPLVYLALQGSGDVVSGSLPVSRRTCYLPSTATEPLPSPLFAAYYPTSETPVAEPAVAAWDVAGIELDPASALPLLAFRIAEDFDGRPGLLIADDLRYWAKPALLALEILVRQRYIPTLARDTQDSGLQPRWRPILGDTEVASRIVTLAENMPFAVRAFSSPPDAVHDLLASFLQGTVDASIRRWLVDTDVAARLTEPPGVAHAVRRWLASLVELGGGMNGDSTASGNGGAAAVADYAAIARDILDWTGTIRTDIDRSGARTSFRLEPPALPATQPRDESTWTLTYHLQPADDQSILIPARQIWKERSHVVVHAGRRLLNPQEKLLGDLGRAARLFSPIERSLRRRRPENAALRLDLVHKFLSEGAPLLRESGFGIQLPRSLEPATATRIGIRGKLSAEPAPLNMDMPVHFEWDVALGDTSLTRSDLQALAEKPVPLIQAGGHWACLSKEEIQAAMRLLAARRSADITLRDALRMGSGKGAVVAGLPVTGAVATGWLDEVLSKLSNPERMQEIPQPVAFIGAMRPYQLRGLSWLDFLTRYGLGACLADDMGLGKTIQLIALALYQRQTHSSSRPILLVCPTSVLGNWEREIRRFAPSLKFLVHHGAGRQKGDAFREGAGSVDMVLSTYSLIARDIQDLGQVEWRGVVLDEAQNIKNPATKQSRAARSLRGTFRVALTGTPVENHPGELWSIMEFLNAGYLGKAEEFRRRFYVPIRFNRDRRAIEQLRKLVQPFMLRRHKTDKQIIQDLPEKYEMKVFCGLTKEQAALYEAIVRDSMKKITQSSGIDRKGAILAALVRLKQVCNHPAHFLNDSSPLLGRSGKLTRLDEMLEEALEEGDRMLIFTQFKVMGDLLVRHLQSRFGHEVLFLHGGVEAKQRTRMVERFEKDENAPRIFVLSVKAGGTGLNLSRANRVFHFDRWWNPAVENQATDRAFRIGQTRDVMVHKYVCAGTVEEKIDAMIEAKKDMADGLIAAGEDWLTEFSTDELATMFTLQKDAVIEL